MNLRRFHNALRVMNSIDRDEMVGAGLIPANDPNAWQQFRCNPTRWMIAATDAQKEGLFALIESRQPKTTPPTDLSSIKLPVRVEQMIGVGGRGPVLVDADGCQLAIVGGILGDIANPIAEALALAVNSYADHVKEIERLKTGRVCSSVLRAAQRAAEPIVAMARAE